MFPLLLYGGLIYAMIGIAVAANVRGNQPTNGFLLFMSFLLWPIIACLIDW